MSIEMVYSEEYYINNKRFNFIPASLLKKAYFFHQNFTLIAFLSTSFILNIGFSCLFIALANQTPGIVSIKLLNTRNLKKLEGDKNPSSQKDIFLKRSLRCLNE